MKQISNNEQLMKELARLTAENRKLKSDFNLAESELNPLLRQCSRESKQLETKVKTMVRSQTLVPPSQATAQKGGLAVLVEHF
jgi:hypothetical protein